MSKEFWDKWIHANALEKEKLVASLPMYGMGTICCPLFSPGLLNSYFEDLYLYMKDAGNIGGLD
jgi:hypothetical protein